MRLRLGVSPQEGTCSRCSTTGPVVVFSAVADGFTGDAEPLCAPCLFTDLSVEVPMQELSPGPAPRRKTLKKNRRLSQEQERDIADELGARTQPGSGNQPGAKGDVRKKGQLRIEAKFTTAASYTLKLEELDKIAGECGDGEKPVFVIDFLEPGTRRPKDRFAVLHFHDAKELLNGIGQHR
jgi:hypothetical protein